MLTRRLLACLTAAMVWLAAAAADPIVGRWQVNAGGAVFDIQPLPGRTDAFVMLWVDGPDFSLEPGTEIGRIFTTAEPGAYDCHAATDPRRQGLRKRSADFVIRFSDSDPNALIFTAYHRRKRVSLWRWVPYLFRITIIQDSNRPDDLEGARRLNSPPRTIEL